MEGHGYMEGPQQSDGNNISHESWWARVQSSEILVPEKITKSKKQKCSEPIMVLTSLYTYPETRTHNLLVPNSALTVSATHPALEMHGTYLAYEGTMPSFTTGERGGEAEFGNPAQHT